jgi:hypothetical protein
MGSPLSRLTSLSIDKKVLLLAVSGMACLCIYRFFDYEITGFFVSDEYGYYAYAVNGGIYSGRWFFGWFTILLFRLLGVNSVDRFSLLLPFYLILWSGLTLILVNRILLLLNFDRKTVALSLLSSFVLISFVLLSLGFLTETMGLTLAMGGIYCLVRFFHSKTDGGRLGFPILAALLFGAAGGTREPYNAFLVAGVVLVSMVALWKARDGIPSRYNRKIMTSFSIVLFILPAGFLYYSNSATTSQFPAIGEQFAQSLITNPATVIPANVTSTKTTVTTVTTITNSTTTITRSGTTSVTVTAVTARNTSTITSTITAERSSYPFYARSLILNTVVIFIGGILLGWGPVAFLFGVVGMAILMTAAFARHRRQDVLVLLIVLSAFGSYLVVSFIFAPDPSYFSFQNYSTIIRFSDTALPAYFLVAPIFLAVFARSRRRMMSLGAVTVTILLLLVPVYETYAASNFNFTSSNPFQFGYRTDAAIVRDYFVGLPSGGPSYVAGLPYGWVFTPGVQDLKSVSVFTFINNGQAPYLNYTKFLSLHWNELYLFSSSPASPGQDLPKFLATPLRSAANSSYPYSISSSRVALEGADFVLLQVTLVWR